MDAIRSTEAFYLGSPTGDDRRARSQDLFAPRIYSLFDVVHVSHELPSRLLVGTHEQLRLLMF